MNLGDFLAPDRQRPFSPSQVPLPIFEPIRWQVSEWRLLFEPPLGKESLHHETSDNNAGFGRDDVELNRLLLLVAVERLRRWRLWKLVRPCWLSSELRCSGVCPRGNDKLPELRFGDWYARLDDNGLSAGHGRAGGVARPARSAADLPLIL